MRPILAVVVDAGELAPSVFISYAHADKPFAHTLAGLLGERGCSVWVDEFELRAGDSLTDRISGAVTSADFVITLVSTGSVESNWCKRELQMALSTGLSEGRTIVLPVRLGDVAMPPALSDILYVPAEHDEADALADRLIRDMCSHAAEVEVKRQLATTEREWQFALEPAHELDSLLGDLEQEMPYLFTPGASRKDHTTFAEAWERWSRLLDKWMAGGRVPEVLRDLGWRLEGLLEVATYHDKLYRANKGIRRRLDRIVGYGIIQVRGLMSMTAQNPDLHAATALEDCSVPDRDELFEMVAADPRLFTLQARVVPAEDWDEEA